MRLWTVHPRYLDRQGLLAVWREGLLAQKVLRGQTHGYRHHPQLTRFRQHPRPIAAMATFLAAVQREAAYRGYHFDSGKISPRRTIRKITVTRGQLRYEWQHLLSKLRQRRPDHARALARTKPSPHPLFRIIAGPVQPWEKAIHWTRVAN